MNLGNLLFCQPENIKRSLRAIECLEKKLVNMRIATVFNQTCLIKWIPFPYVYEYTYIYIRATNIERILGKIIGVKIYVWIWCGQQNSIFRCWLKLFSREH